MSNHAYTNREKDAGRKRREYLLAQGAASALGCAGACITLGSGIATIVSSGSLVVSTSYIEQRFGMFALCLVSTAISAAITYLGIRMFQSSERIAEKTPYVPPVAEQIAALPAEELLVRGVRRTRRHAG